MNKLVMQRVLNREQQEAGLFLEEPDDHTILLKRDGCVLAVFSQLGATIESIRAEVDKHL